MRLEKIARQFSQKINFLCIYIKEAHPIDGSQSPPNLIDDILFKQPTSMDERAEIASACMLRFNFSFPMVLDSMSDYVEKAYMAMPERLYILDSFGTVTWKCGLGPHLFDLVGFEQKIKDLSDN